MFVAKWDFKIVLRKTFFRTVVVHTVNYSTVVDLFYKCLFETANTE